MKTFANNALPQFLRRACQRLTAASLNVVLNSKAMKLSIVTVLLSVALNSCAQKIDCGSFRTGTFTTQTKTNGVIIITRTATQSIEEIPALGKKMINSIKWTGDCTFTIQYESGDKPPSPTAAIPIDCEIIQVGDDFHVVHSRIRGTEIQMDYKMENKRN